MSTIKIAATDGSGSFDALVVAPKTQAPTGVVVPEARGVVVMIQEIFGVNAAMQALSAWVADMGFIAIAPDLF